MGEALKLEVVLKEDGKFDLPPVNLPPGTRLTITVEQTPDTGKKRPLRDFIGCAKGLFASPDEVDAFIRQERESWGHREEP